jgi:hypothetical protein
MRIRREQDYVLDAWRIKTMLASMVVAEADEANVAI